MEHKFSALIRLFIVIGIILAIYLSKLEYTIPLALLSVAYLILFFIIEPEEKSLLKYIFLLIDITFLSSVIFLSGLPYLSVFIIPLFSDFMRTKKDLIIFTILSTVPIGLSIYMSNFKDLLFIPLILGGVVGFFKLEANYNKKEKRFKKLKKDMEEVYIQNIKFQDILEEQKKLISVLKLLKMLKNKELRFKEFLFRLKENLNADGIVYFDYINSRCISTDNSKCEKAVLKYITKDLQIFENSVVNEILKGGYIGSIVFEQNGKFSGVLFIVYKIKPRDNSNIYETIRDYINLILCEITKD